MKNFDTEILEKSIIQKGNILKSCFDEEIFKSWSSDLQKRFPNAEWRTINGAKVLLNNGKVVAGLDGFNGMIDKFFEKEKKDKEDKEIKIGDVVSKNKNDKYVVVGDYIFNNDDLKDNTEYISNRNGMLVENKDSNRHTVKGNKYVGNGKPEDAINLLNELKKIDEVYNPKSQVLDLAFDDLGISINDFKRNIEVNGQIKRMPEYWSGGFDKYKQSVREYLDQLPKLSNAVDDKIIKKWYYETILSKLKQYNTPDQLSVFVNDDKVNDAIKYWKNKNNK